jgi:hypothetical protein
MFCQICMMFTKQNVILTILSELKDYSDEPEILNQIIWMDLYPELLLLTNQKQNV